MIFDWTNNCGGVARLLSWLQLGGENRNFGLTCDFYEPQNPVS